MPDRLNRSSSTFNPSMHSVYPTVNSVDWRRKLGRSRWDLFKPWRTHTWSQNLNGTYPDLPRQAVLHGSTVSTGQKSPETMVVRRGSIPFWPMPMHPNGHSSFSLVPGAPGSQPFDSPQPIFNGSSSPWLRTTSTTHLTQQPAAYMNSSGEVSSPMDGYPFNHPWWQPWRRSLKKQRRLYMHLQRRREAQYQSQRRLMESSAMSNGSSSQIALTPSSIGMVNSSSRDSNSLIDQRNMMMVVPNPDRPLSQRTTGSSRTFTTSDGGTVTPGAVETAIQSNQANDQTRNAPRFGYTNWDLADNAQPHCASAQPYQEIQPQMERPPSVAGDTLPWKSTPTTSSNSFSNGLRRFSSFLRNLNGSLTPPRAASRRSQSQLINQSHPQSMSTLDSPNYFGTGAPIDMTGQSNAAMGRVTCFPFTPTHTGFPRAKSESGSVRLGRGLGLRNLFNIPITRESATLYNLDVDDCTAGDPLSSSTGTPTKTSVIHLAPSTPKPDDWARYYPDCTAGLSDATQTTLRAQAPMTVHYAPATSTQLYPYLAQTGTPVPMMQPSQGAYSPTQPQQQQPDGNRLSGLDNPHCNDPYLEPVSLKRLRVEAASGTVKPAHFSDSDHQPSATSSAISSLVFADSVVDDELDPDSYSTTQRTIPSAPTPPVAPPLPPPITSRPLTNNPGPGNSRGFDYVTYDLTRSGTAGTNTLTNASPSTANLKSLGMGGELLATQLNVNGANEDLGPLRRPKRNPEQAGGDSSRPLSEAMISNHYYDANEFGFVYPDTPSSAAPAPPPRVSLSAARQAPNIRAPMWNTTNDPARSGPVTVSSQSRLAAHMARGEFGSMDSLYETVDQFPGHNPTSHQQPRENQADVAVMANLLGSSFADVLFGTLEEKP
ncbi:unnamed protein product [Echinostoma caproni]|uniref:CREB-regulated transcription coactivator 2 n=1 Tax=Echinostoma caproni TaxID=27848 RepID=A0A183A735_9TREM|nr:unnamed protein product [Echinostoma caproni]